jgi:hypothetical protein
MDGNPAGDDLARDHMAEAIVAAVQGAMAVHQVVEFGAVLKARSKAVRDGLVDLADRVDTLTTETDLVVRTSTALGALSRAEKAAGLSDDQRTAVTKAGPLREALLGAKAPDDKLVALLRLEGLLQKASIPVVYQHDQHFWDGMDATFADKAERTARFRSFVGRFLAVTAAHDFTPDIDQRRLHSGLQASIWRCRHANADEFDVRMADCERRLRALCALAGVPEPTDADLSPETLVDGFNPEPEQIATIEDRDDAVRRERAIVLERFRDLVNRVTPAVDQADYSDPEQRQIAADLRAAMTRAAHTSSLSRMTAAMVEAERHLAHLLTGEDPGEEGEGDDGPDY